MFGPALLPLGAQQITPPATSQPPPRDAAVPVSTTGDTSSEEDVFTLSPFVVNASKDVGYLVGNTLSGNRVRSDLTDIASSVSVMNSEFLKDIGARDLQDALRYEVNSENENEVVYDDSEGTITGDGTSNRVRGLGEAQLSREFFNTRLPIDTYNTDRFTISRGPNSILFGIGSPSGSVDANLKRAQFSKTSGSASATFDQHSTQRYELDFNQPLGKSLALRFDYLNQDKRTFMSPEYDKEHRLFATGTWRPFKRTTLTVNFEDVHDDRVRARRHTLFDGVSDWIKAGKPLYDAFSKSWVDSAGNPVTRTGAFIEGHTYRDYIYSNNRPVAASAWNGITLASADQHYTTQGNQATYAGGDQANSYTGSYQNLLGLNNQSLYPYDLNYTGLANWAHIDAKIYTARLEQQIFDGLDAELAFNREDYSNQSVENARGNFTILEADVNKYLTIHDSTGKSLLKDANGNYVKILNPNAGRYRIKTQGIGFDRGSVADSFRGTLSYDLNLARFHPWLGRHQIAAMYQRDDTDAHIVKTRTKNLGDQIPSGFVVTADQNNINHIAYLDLPGDSDGSGQSTPALWRTPAENGLTWWKTITGPTQETAIHSRVTNDARLAVLTSRFDQLWRDSQLVVTAGVRRDTQKIFDAPIKLSDIDYTTGASKWPTIPIPSDPSYDETGDTSTMSLVYHTPLKGLSLSYSRSDNFTPQTKYLDFEGRPQTAMKGRSNEYGVSFESANKRFYARLTRFDAKALNQKEEDWFFWEPAWTAIYYMEYFIWDYATNIYPTRGIDKSADMVGSLSPWVQSDRQVPFRDRASTGYELELIARPIDNLNLRFTAAKTDAVDTNIASDMIAYIKRRMPVWDKYADLTASWYRNSWDYADPTYDDPRNLYWGDYSEGRKNIYAAGYMTYNWPGGIARVEDLEALEGASTIRSRATAMNLTADYNFANGRLKGFSIGGGARYRAPAAIGYLGKVSTNPDLPAGTLVADLSKPVMGDPLLNFDLWIGYTRDFVLAGRKLTWAVNLYGWNITSNGGLQPGSVNRQGGVDRWIIKEPRTISLANTIAF